MLKLDMFSDSDLFIMAMIALTVSMILGLLADLLMGDRGFGPVRNAGVIMAGGFAGMVLRSLYYPVPNSQLLVASVLAAIGAATLALVVAGVAKTLVQT